MEKEIDDCTYTAPKGEFKLKDKRILVDKYFAHYPEEDVKEFIKIIDDDFLDDWTNSNGKTFTLNEIREIIKNRTGDLGFHEIFMEEMKGSETGDKFREKLK